MKDKLKVGMVVRNFSTAGGLELYAHKVIEGLLDRGHDVTVFCQTVETDLSHPNLSTSPIELRSRGLNKAGRLNHDYIAGNRALAEAKGFDIIHSQHYPTALATVATFHNHAVLRWSEVGFFWEKVINDTKSKLVTAYKLRDFHDRTLCANAQCVVFPSQTMKDDYYHAYPFLEAEHKPYVVAFPGSSLRESAEEYALPQRAANEPFTFLFVGRGYRRKGLDVVLAACSKLAKEKPNFRLLIAGLSAKPLDQARLALLGLTGKVKYLGFQKDMDAVYAQAQAAVLPSRVEPFGMDPLQAMERGLVAIVSRVSGVSEVLNHDIDSLILENHLDSGDLARLMGRLMDDEQLVQRLGCQARQTAKKVNWNQTAENTLRAYELVLDKTNRGLQTAVK